MLEMGHIFDLRLSRFIALAYVHTFQLRHTILTILCVILHLLDFTMYSHTYANLIIDLNLFVHF